jgi:hypothetical protein
MKYFFLFFFSLNSYAAGKIVNADIAPSGTANIARNKLAASTAHNACTFDNSGYIAGGVAPGVSGNIFQSNGTDWTSVGTSDLTDAGTDGITVTGGTGAVIGSGTSLSQHVSDATHNGYLSSADWNTFNGKQSTVSFGAFGSLPNGNAGVISGGVITLEPADASNPGGVSTSAQAFAGTKTFDNIIDNGLSVSQAVVTDGSKQLASLAYSIVSSATSLVERDANQNAFANNFVSKSTNVVSSGGTTTLTAASSRLQNLTGSSAQTFVLPDATTLSVGARFEFDNNSTGLLTIQANGGGAIATVPAGGYSVVKATAVSTSAGVWDAHFLVPSNNQWGTSNLTMGVAGSSSGVLNLSGSSSGVVTIQPQAAAGTYNFNLPTSGGSSGQPLLSGGGGGSAMTFGTLGGAAGGTGQTSYTDGQLLIGNSSGNTLTKATLTAGSGISITNGNGSISIAASGGSSTIYSGRFDCGTGTADANTTLLLTFDTGSTITDYSSSNLNSGWSFSGTGNVNATHVQFGAGAIDVSSNGGLSHGGNAVFALGTGDFTIDFWIYVTTFATPIDFVAIQGASGNSWSVSTNSGSIAFVRPGVAVVASQTNPSTNAYHHIAVVRSSGTVTVYVDGVGGTGVANSTNFNNSSSSFVLGPNSSFNNASTGWIDEVRISNNARWTSNFTPPAAPYSITNTIYVNNGSFLSSITGGGSAGQCFPQFAGGKFSTEPVCTATPVNATANSLVSFNAANSTSAASMTNVVSGAATNGQVYMVCQ